MISVPPAELWLQYNIIGILFLCLILMALAFWFLWKSLLRWQESQDKKRESEREKQREWEAQQRKEQDARQHNFLREMQRRWEKSDKQQSQALNALAAQVTAVTMAVNAHDTYVRGRMDEMEAGK